MFSDSTVPGARLEAISGTAVASSSSVRTAVTSHALGISPRAWRLVGVFGDGEQPANPRVSPRQRPRARPCRLRRGGGSTRLIKLRARNFERDGGIGRAALLLDSEDLVQCATPEPARGSVGYLLVVCCPHVGIGRSLRGFPPDRRRGASALSTGTAKAF